MDLEEGVPIPATSSDAGNTINSHSGIKAAGPHHHHHNPEEHHEYDPQLKVAFVPPIEGTPAALALAGELRRKHIDCAFCDMLTIGYYLLYF